jgi:hypothetical protein
MKKKIAFIAPIWDWWPKILYNNLVNSLNKNNNKFEYFLISSIKEWIILHFSYKKYDIIISSVPFIWKPFCENFIIHLHWFYKLERWISSMWKLLCWLYPYNIYLSKLAIFPSFFLKNYYKSSHLHQDIIYNFSNFEVKKKLKKNISNKKIINLLTVTSFSFYNKAKWILDIFNKLENINNEKLFNYYICWKWKYLDEIKSSLKNYLIPKNITIIFLWGLNNNDLKKILNKSDIFLYSTFQETFWISIIEAMSFWIPILLNNYELFNELYEDEFICKNNVDFKNKLNKLILDKDYYKFYLEKWYNNLKRFDKNQIIQEWDNLINSNLINN